MPDGVSDWELWFDTTPLRPDEWARTEAAPFSRAMSIQDAYRSGQADAVDGHKATKGQ